MERLNEAGSMDEWQWRWRSLSSSDLSGMYIGAI